VHRTGGVLVQHLKEHQLHCDIRPGDRVLYFTTTGWMMWNWLVSTLGSGATAVCYDGSPFHPSPTVLFDVVDRERVALLGVSAKFLDSLRKAGERPTDTHDLGSLRTICSTGSPLSAEGFGYVYDAIKRDVHLASISGGTDLCACFVGSDPTSPVYAGELQRPALGMAVDVWNDDGRSLANEPGIAGELVCTEPFPSMPLGFWRDGTDGVPDPATPGPRYLAAYYERFAPGGVPSVWAHGDFASWTKHGGMVIHGRSDATLNPGGVRIGTAEIYRVVEQLPEVAESLVFAQQWDSDVRVVLLVRMVDGHALDDALVAEIRGRIRAACTPRHVPAVIAEVDDLPRTRSNKLVELAVADAVNGRPVRNTEGLANPEAIDAIVALDALRLSGQAEERGRLAEPTQQALGTVPPRNEAERNPRPNRRSPGDRR
jgi:acetoacetyl-CoA synthetase